MLSEIPDQLLISLDRIIQADNREYQVWTLFWNETVVNDQQS